MQKKTGTREWAQKTVNIATGCEHDCRYCYARHNAAYRFKRVKADDWPNMVVNPASVNKRYGKYKGVVMFPSTHDITPSILRECCDTLVALLRAGNQVLIVTKPHWECITILNAKLSHYKERKYSAPCNKTKSFVKI